jgi:hypothetical protein
MEFPSLFGKGQAYGLEMRCWGRGIGGRLSGVLSGMQAGPNLAGAVMVLKPRCCAWLMIKDLKTDMASFLLVG